MHMLMVTMQKLKATSLEDPDDSAFHTTLSFFHPLLLGILDQHL